MNFNKIVGYILNILTIIIVAILILAGTYMVQTKLLHYDYANIFGYTVFKIATGSMSPTIEVEDIVIVKITNENIKKDDIIVFKQEKDLITHRVTAIDDEKITTKGDANNSEDKQIEKQNVVGKVINIIPNIAVWKKVFLTPEIFISITVTIILLYVAFTYKGKDDNTKEK